MACLLSKNTPMCCLTALICQKSLNPPTSEEFRIRTPKTTPLMGLFLSKAVEREEGGFGALSIFRDQWVGDRKQSGGNDINKVAKTCWDPSNCIHM